MAAKKLQAKILDELFAITEDEGGDTGGQKNGKIIPINQKAQAQIVPLHSLEDKGETSKAAAGVFSIRKKNLLLLGGLLIVGIALYLYFDSKKKEEEKKG